MSFSNHAEYLKFIEKRVLNDQWRVGWFKTEINVDIYGLKCNLLFLGHSRHFESIKPFFFSRIQSVFIYPYSAVAMVFCQKEVDHSLIDGILSSVREFIKKRIITTPEGVDWGIDVAYIALVSVKKIPEYVKEYFRDFFEPIVDDQYMQEEYPGISGYKRIHKAVGMCLVDLATGNTYCHDDVFSREAGRLFKPELYLIERLENTLKKLLLSFL